MGRERGELEPNFDSGFGGIEATGFNCTVVWGQKNKIEFVGGSKSDNAFPYFTPIFPPNFTNPNTFSMGQYKHCSVVVNTSHDAPPIDSL